MPISPSSSHSPGVYPDTIRHISNGDPANQTFLRNPSIDLEYRTDVLREFVNALESTVNGNFDTLTAFDANHDHSGANGEQVVDFSQVYANSNPVETFFNLAAAGKFAIKVSGDNTAADLLRLTEDGATNKDKIFFPGSDDLFDHQAAPASDLALNPHGLQLAARMITISTGCTVGQTADDQQITLNPALAAGQVYAAPEILGLTAGSITGTLAEGVVCGTANNALASPPNIVLVINSATGDLVMSGLEPVYGLLENQGTPSSPTWVLSFFTKSGSYTFLQTGGSKTLKLYGQYAYSLSTVPVVDSRFVTLCKEGQKVL